MRTDGREVRAVGAVKETCECSGSSSALLIPVGCGKTHRSCAAVSLAHRSGWRCRQCGAPERRHRPWLRAPETVRLQCRLERRGNLHRGYAVGVQQENPQSSELAERIMPQVCARRQRHEVTRNGLLGVKTQLGGDSGDCLATSIQRFRMYGVIDVSRIAPTAQQEQGAATEQKQISWLSKPLAQACQKFCCLVRRCQMQGVSETGRYAAGKSRPNCNSGRCGAGAGRQVLAVARRQSDNPA